MTILAKPRGASRVRYPESDGKPMGETDLHRRLMTDLIFALQIFLADVRAYVAGNLFVYYEEGNPRKVVCPDVFVALGVDQYERRTYRAWEEGGKLPDVVVELTSKKTAKEDREVKPALYATLGVAEYFQFDPYAEYMRPPLQGFRLVDGVYQPIPEFPMRSGVLGLTLRQENTELRLYETQTGRRLLFPREAEAARAEARARAEAELARLRAARGE